MCQHFLARLYIPRQVDSKLLWRDKTGSNALQWFINFVMSDSVQNSTFFHIYKFIYYRGDSMLELNSFQMVGQVSKSLTTKSYKSDLVSHVT